MTDDNKKDQQLWKIAKKRAGFKHSLLSYIGINILFIVIWTLTGRGYFWLMWTLIFWGFAILMQYFRAYHGFSAFSTEKEYEKLKK